MHIEPIKPHSPSVPPPSPGRVPEPQPGPQVPSAELIRRIFRNQKNLEWELGSGFHSGPIRKRKGYVLTLWSFVASTIDALLLIGMSCIFLMVFIKILKMPVNKDVLKDFAMIYVMFSWLYMITTRFFIGSSIGEAACDIRLGKPQERMSSWYFLRVVFRATLIVGTGVVLLPALSLLLGRDIPGALSGLRLFSLR